MKRKVKISKAKKVRVYKPDGTQMSTSKYPHGGEHGEEGIASGASYQARAKKAQEAFDKDFKVKAKSKYEESEERVNRFVEDFKKTSKEAGRKITKKDEDRVREEAWFHEGVKPLGMTSNQDVVRQGKERTFGDYEDRAWDIVTNPTDAFWYSIHGGLDRMPWNYNDMLSHDPMFSKDENGNIVRNPVPNYIGTPLAQEHNSLAFLNQMANPAKWLDIANRDLEEGNYVLAGLGLVPFLGKAGKGLSKADNLKIQKAINKADSTPSTSFKSEIDWGKWNKKIPKNKALMSEYNTIEETAKRNGTWMKNADGSRFRGTPEQFVQQNSENFKKAFPNILKKDGNVLQLTHHSDADFSVFDKSYRLSGVGQAKYGEGIYTVPKPYFDKFMTKKFSELGHGPGKKPVYVGYGKNRYDLYVNDKGVNFFQKIPESTLKYNPNKKYPRYKTEPHTAVVPWESQVKSAIGNSGMFDMTNPDIKAGLTWSFNPLSYMGRKLPNNAYWRKMGSLKGRQSMIDNQGIVSPSNDHLFFSKGNKPNENYRGIYATSYSPSTGESVERFTNFQGPRGQHRGMSPVSGGQSIKNLPISDPGVEVWRRLPFSNAYTKVDKQKILSGDYSPVMKAMDVSQDVAERLVKTALWGSLGQATINSMYGTDENPTPVGTPLLNYLFRLNSDGVSPRQTSEPENYKFIDGGKYRTLFR